ncbi:hypothetical protein ACOSP6_06815 [Tenacibaculum sp. MEBiC06402]|uniref:hypothetical protein n=1 Tax=unclassified Tenacibaculum TaxID=2635139 RepID=UPI003B993CF0
MKNLNKLIAFLLISVGLWTIFYKESGFYGWGGYVDKSLENIIISSLCIGIGIFILKRKT